MTDPPPVLQPVAPPPRRRTPLAGVVVAGLLAAVAVGAAVVGLIHGGRGPSPDAGPAVSRFGPGTTPRVAALADRLVRGLLALRLPDGRFAPRPVDSALEPVEFAEATGMALSGLSAARRMGSRVEGLSDAIAGARAALRASQRPDGGFGAAANRSRSVAVLATSAAALGWALAGEPEDGPPLEAASEWIAHETGLGPLPDGWPRGLATMATLALARTGHAKGFPPDPIAAVQTRDVGTVRDARDQRVAEALARAIRERGGPPEPFCSEIFG